MQRTVLLLMLTSPLACTSTSPAEELGDRKHEADPEEASPGAASETSAELFVGQRALCPGWVEDQAGLLCSEPEQATSSGDRVMCGACLASRAEVLAFAVEMFADVDELARIRGCAAEGRCEGWKLCSEAGEGDFDARHWISSYIGWAIAPERGFFRGDGNAGPDEQRSCRPYDAALWIEAATVLARMSDHRELSPRARALELGHDYDVLTTQLQPGCVIEGVEAGGQWWIPATVTFNNHGLLCMPSNDSGARTANICGTERLADCYASREILTTVADRIRGEAALAECPPIDLRRITCEQ